MMCRPIAHEGEIPKRSLHLLSASAQVGRAKREGIVQRRIPARPQPRVCSSRRGRVPDLGLRRKLPSTSGATRGSRGELLCRYSSPPDPISLTSGPPFSQTNCEDPGTIPGPGHIAGVSFMPPATKGRTVIGAALRRQGSSSGAFNLEPWRHFFSNPSWWRWRESNPRPPALL